MQDGQGHRLTARHDATGGAPDATLQTVAAVQNASRRLTQRTASPAARARSAGLAVNAFGQLRRVTRANGAQTAFGYDARHRAAGMQDARGNATGIHRDDFGNRIWQDSPDSGRTQFAYDKADHRVWQKNANGAVTTAAYDAAGRITRQTTPAGITRFVYAHGQLTRLTGPGYQEQFTYTATGPLRSHTRTIDGHTWTTRYGYSDKTGLLTSKTLPDGQTLRYRRDSETSEAHAIMRDNWFSATPIINDITRRPFGPLKRWTYRDGTTATLVWAADGASSRVPHGGTRRSGENARHRQAAARPAPAQRDGYDRSGRLTAAATAAGTVRYTYDALGNRTRRHRHGQTTVYRYAPHSNRLHAVQHGAHPTDAATTHYRYDAAGNPIVIGDQRYTYNAANRPVMLAVHGKPRAEYAYNAFGERIKQITYNNGQRQVQYFLYDGRQRTATANDDGTIIGQYVYLGRRPVAKLEGRTVYAIHTDRLGTPQRATDKNGTVVWAASYDPFGRVHITTHEITLNLRFPGQYADPASGLYYNYYRDYDPETGRYLTSDPMGILGGRNTYAYVHNDPVSGFDPLGLFDAGETVSEAKLDQLAQSAQSRQAFVDQELQSFQDRVNFYTWVNNYLHTKPGVTRSNWFYPAAEVNKDRDLGGVDSRLAGIAFSYSTIRYLRTAGRRLAFGNIETFLQLRDGEAVLSCPANDSPKNRPAAILARDKQLVIREQGHLQDISEAYWAKNNYDVAVNTAYPYGTRPLMMPAKKLATTEINGFFNKNGLKVKVARYLKLTDPKIDKIIQEQFLDKNIKFDIANEHDRLILGFKLVEANVNR